MLPLNGVIAPTGGGGTGGTPDPHAASHENGGGDELALDGSQITSGTLVHERGGLEADVSAYDGIPKISGGATSQATAGTDYVSPRTAGMLQAAAYNADLIHYHSGSIGAGYTNGSLVVAANRLYVAPFFVPINRSVVRDFSIRVSAGVASTNARFGLYTNDPSTFLPLDLVANTDSGNQSTASNNTTRTFTPGATVTLTPGTMYWMCIHFDGAPTMKGLITGPYAFGGNSIDSDNQYIAHYWVSQTFGAMPSSYPGGSRTPGIGVVGHMVFVRWTS